jgi:putative hydrolases of HD superfamily
VAGAAPLNLGLSRKEPGCGEAQWLAANFVHALAMPSRISQQMAFITELDKLKGVLRRTSPIGLERRENSAEHSWQVVLCAIILAEHATTKVDILKVIKMLAIHDTVEIDVGDTFHYDKAAQADLH